MFCQLDLFCFYILFYNFLKRYNLWMYSVMLLFIFTDFQKGCERFRYFVFKVKSVI